MSLPQAILRIFTNSNISEAYFLKKLKPKGWVSGAYKRRGSEVENFNTLTANLEVLYQKSITDEKI